MYLVQTLDEVVDFGVEQPGVFAPLSHVEHRNLREERSTVKQS